MAPGRGVLIAVMMVHDRGGRGVPMIVAMIVRARDHAHDRDARHAHDHARRRHRRADRVHRRRQPRARSEQEARPLTQNKRSPISAISA